MQPTILQKIIATKQQWLTKKQADLPLAHFYDDIHPSTRSFYQALQQAKGRAFILECKKASPSKGLIRQDFDLDKIAQVYQRYATAISVLTDEAYFQGDFAYLEQVSHQVAQPVLCKDFIISTYQVYLARYHQADAVLLMLSVLDDETYIKLAQLAHHLGMGVLTEASNEAEFARALALDAQVIGVNNRNLHDLSVDLSCVVRLVQSFATKIPKDTLIISESGIYTHQQVQALSKVADGFLIGSSLMAEADLDSAVRALIFGENKVCGLTRVSDVQAAYEQGALYGGLIFALSSKRRLDVPQAQALIAQAKSPLRFVGVFQNQSIDFVAKTACRLSLFAVQLHGQEDTSYIETLYQRLGGACQIWQAIAIDVDNPAPVLVADNPHIARFVFDSQQKNRQGGVGLSFDWQFLPQSLKHKALLAGGIGVDNIKGALAQGCLGVDVNSGVECAIGVKDGKKLQAVFESIKQYPRRCDV